jgi:hypothetical protein
MKKLQDIYPGVRVEVEHISGELKKGYFEILSTTKEEWQKEYELEGNSVHNYRSTHTHAMVSSHDAVSRGHMEISESMKNVQASGSRPVRDPSGVSLHSPRSPGKTMTRQGTLDSDDETVDGPFSRQGTLNRQASMVSQASTNF